MSSDRPERTGGGGCDFTSLGWLQFEQLCSQLIEAECGVPPASWSGAADTARWVTVDGQLTGPLVGSPRDVPAVVRVVWIPRSTSTIDAARARVRRAMAAGETLAGGSVVVLTNVWANEEFHSLVRKCVEPGTESVVLGRAELDDLIDAHPDAWLVMPSVMGARDLTELVAPDVLAASRFDFAAAQDLAPTFVATAAYRRACDVLTRHGFTVLSGPPEMGKTAAARTVGIVKLCQGWEVHECLSPDELWKAFRRDRRQVFIADDAFGSTEYRADAAERWALELDLILKQMHHDHWLIWTSRPAPLTAGLRRVNREHGLERFPKPADVIVDATDLSIEEKALMIYRHAVAAETTQSTCEALRVLADEIVGHPHFTPERIRRLIWERLPMSGGPHSQPLLGSVWREVMVEIARPTDAMAASLNALDPEYRDVLVAMLDVPSPPVPERDLAAAIRRHDVHMEQPISTQVEHLADHFLRPVAPASVAWVHPSWRDLVIDRLASEPDRRRAFLRSCGIEGALLAVSTQGGPSGDRVLPMMVEDADWDALLAHIDELVHHLDDGDRARLLEQLAAALHDRRDNHDQPALAELDALATRVLGAVALTPITPASLDVLESWHEVGTLIEHPPSPPGTTEVWIETLPTTDTDLASEDDVERLSTWVQLATTLDRYDPASLKVFGFPTGQEETLRLLLSTDPDSVAKGLLPPDANTLSHAMRALAPLVPELATPLRRFAHATSYAAADDEPEEQSWTTEVDADTAVSDREYLPGRVLADLEPPPRRSWRRRRSQQ